MAVRAVLAVGTALSLTIGLSACSAQGTNGSGGAQTIKVAYQTTATFQHMQTLMETAKKEYESTHAGVTIQLVPIQSEGNDYYTKLALMNKSASTAPDVQYEDTFKIQSDSAAGYLLPLDDRLEKWADWPQFVDGAKQAGRGADGKTYGISLGTDTRGLWYNTELLQKAGVSTPWQPKTWADVLDAAARVKAAVPDVIPLNVYSGKAAGEAASMQGLEMLLYGTKDALFDTESRKWIVGSKGFKDSLTFIRDVYQNGLGPTPQQALDPNIYSSVTSQWLPSHKLAIDLDGSWVSGTWITGGSNPWPEWSSELAVAPMPTQYGDAPGKTSMSGGWTLAIGAKTSAPDLAFDFVTTALSKKNSQSYAISSAQIPVRTDVAKDPHYSAANPTFEFFSSLVPVTHFRPATQEYDQISNAITVAMEAVMTGQQGVDEAAGNYDRVVEKIVGHDAVQRVE
ncbi:extracellular solute-binding protein [Rathayibacter toxicus]|uniref:extracellular solute-binding protein n=1 Tax=Rathayibacter toxicus TaxID=145458 RepID=UPI001C051740|nr:extracellular solute-binding protein [Rathayibacter toxicus]QWL31918.1 extracellular solute-binding protein [Rathayibacter toxicus]QWL34012.1 extracellular solute-binding protein [Rathayibacter toxicus]QWL36144.1 extracellular solute-binding protein [Rathayibacter toxicus]QWL38235.1 extracellular solute-binding protein [Rathayibacter toxicus]QWL40324.1 extracellular solute-binding protein [Rathayibacter toxicus]